MHKSHTHTHPTGKSPALLTAQTAISIFNHFFTRYQEEMLDDETEFMPMVRNILDGALSVSETPEEAKELILRHIESCYISSWNEEARKQAQKEFRSMIDGSSDCEQGLR
ncbi:hypothetical protein FGF68_00815 [Prosthecochloris vibrioformis]|uniref:Uncharacterized protein n=2 Tax=Prosthecochloris vibrioformis TaxID=1098 RepID=A0A5C4S3M4_PROVB|nr:hypothetical protein FGF68_00815 [Prosthecochloris vibrioformis]